MKKLNQKEMNQIKLDIVNELHKPRRLNFDRLKVIIKGFDETWSCDLSEWIPFAKTNNGMKYALMVIDNFSKFAFCEAIPDKTSQTVANTFEKIIKKSKRYPKKIQTDQGLIKFINKLIKAYKNIKCFRKRILWISIPKINEKI
jgi:type III secretion system FlhB-like substrate exporter